MRLVQLNKNFLQQRADGNIPSALKICIGENKEKAKHSPESFFIALMRGGQIYSFESCGGRISEKNEEKVPKSSDLGTFLWRRRRDLNFLI